MEREFTENSPRWPSSTGTSTPPWARRWPGPSCGVPLAHVEAGLRSFDDTMPEEINRRLTDQLCALLFATSPEAIGYLAREGRPVSAVHLVGNPMIDTLLAHLDRFDVAAARAAAGLPERYVVATLHRPSNVDDPQAAAALVRALHEVADELDLIIPVHPRGRAALEAAGLGTHPGLHVCDPLGYLEFMALVKGAAAVITDSGGVQEETTLLRVPCLTLRPNTERPITITSGSNRLVTDAELAAAVLKACHDGPYTGRAAAAVGRPRRPADRPDHHRLAGPGGPPMSTMPRDGPDVAAGDELADAETSGAGDPAAIRAGRGTRPAGPHTARHPAAAGHDAGAAGRARGLRDADPRPDPGPRRAAPVVARRPAAAGPDPAVAGPRRARPGRGRRPSRWRRLSSLTWRAAGNGSCPR